MKPTVVLVNFYRLVEFVNSRPLMPLACLYLGSYLETKGYHVVIQEVRAAEEIDSFVKEAIKLNPILIGVSGTFGLYTADYIEYSSKIKQEANIPVVWGGVHVGSIFDLVLKKNFVDFVIRGEGEIALFELAEAIREKRGFGNVRNLIYKDNEKLIINNMTPVTEKNVDLFPLNFDLLDNYDQYVETTYAGDRIFHALQASRGCPHNCTFCYNNEFNKRRWRKHSIDRVLSDVLELRQRVNFNKIRFIDDQFFANSQRAKDIIATLYDHGITLFIPDMRLENLTEDMIEFLLKHELDTVFVGTESENDRVLQVMKKNLSQERILEKFNLIKKYPEFKVHTGFILGIPTHTKTEIINSIKFALKWQFKIPNLKIGLETYLPFPGSDMYQTALKHGFPKPDKVEYYIGLASSSKTGKFKRYQNMEWLHIEPKLKKRLNYINWISAFYSSLIIPPKQKFHRKVLLALFNLPFLLVTYFRIRTLTTAHHQLDQKLYKIVGDFLCKLYAVIFSDKNNSTTS